jgi:hypothetical protein
VKYDNANGDDNNNDDNDEDGNKDNATYRVATRTRRFERRRR